MVLAAMLKESVLKKAREEGRKEAREERRKEAFEEGREEAFEEGREEGRKEVREERRKRWDEAYAKFGFEVDGVLVLPLTPEVLRFLDGEDEPEVEQ